MLPSNYYSPQLYTITQSQISQSVSLDENRTVRLVRFG